MKEILKSVKVVGMGNLYHFEIDVQLSHHLEVLNLDSLHESTESYEQQDPLVHDTGPASFDWRDRCQQAFRDGRDILPLFCNLL